MRHRNSPAHLPNRHSPPDSGPRASHVPPSHCTGWSSVGTVQGGTETLSRNPTNLWIFLSVQHLHVSSIFLKPGSVHSIWQPWRLEMPKETHRRHPVGQGSKKEAEGTHSGPGRSSGAGYIHPKVTSQQTMGKKANQCPKGPLPVNARLLSSGYLHTPSALNNDNQVTNL